MTKFKKICDILAIGWVLALFYLFSGPFISFSIIVFLMKKSSIFSCVHATLYRCLLVDCSVPNHLCFYLYFLIIFMFLRLIESLGIFETFCSHLETFWWVYILPSDWVDRDNCLKRLSWTYYHFKQVFRFTPSVPIHPVWQ